MINKRVVLCGLIPMILSFCQMKKEENLTENESQPMVKLMTLQPGHFHAGLIHKDMYEEVDSTIYVFANQGPELQDFLSRVTGYNTRSDSPTAWKLNVDLSEDPLSRMLSESPGNVMVVAGKKDQKIDYILGAIQNGIHVYADKPLVINEDGFQKLEQAMKLADEEGLLLYDIMTERYEITSILQKRLSENVELFGEQEKGSLENPGITKESVHHFFKYVSGNPLVRPTWFFDSSIEGDGLVDVTTHLVDLIQWALFPEENLKKEDAEVLQARLWSTELDSKQFEQVTGEPLNQDALEVDCNGEMDFRLKGVHAKVKVTWEYQAPEGAGDTHYSKMRGSRANLIIRQGPEENFVPQLYVELLDASEGVLTSLVETDLQEQFPGLGLEKISDQFYRVEIPDSYRVGHEAHFAQVTDRYLDYMKNGAMPTWEQDFIRVKYFITTQASALARK
ncbi:putative oxidoreductase C-terminal domain-containing protein [Algoriphagus namhaensis]